MAIIEKIKLSPQPAPSYSNNPASSNVGRSFNFIIEAAEKRRRLATQRALQMQSQMGISQPLKVVK